MKFEVLYQVEDGEQYRHVGYTVEAESYEEARVQGDVKVKEQFPSGVIHDVTVLMEGAGNTGD